MCGLIGFYDPKHKLEISDLVLATKSLSHRGPDNWDTYVNDHARIFFGHVRLSIIDTGSAANQPFERNNYRVIFNGEIYNFRNLRNELSLLGINFYTQSDTEVILAAYETWGLKFAERLNGMFALCIFDPVKNSLILARDRSGEKPLFVHWDKNIFAFASELKALLLNKNFSKKISINALHAYLHRGYVPNNECIFEDFFKLEPGCILAFDLDTHKTKKIKFWEIPKLIKTKKPINDNAELICELERILIRAVKNQLISDVPIAHLLSGGLDSSILVGLSSQLGQTLNTYTVSFPASGNFDEAIYAKQIASYFSTNHTEIIIDDISKENVFRILKQYDEPLADSSCFPTAMVSDAISRDYKVALGGDGADELFGGYHSNNREYFLNKYFKRVRGKIPDFYLSNIIKICPNKNIFKHIKDYLNNQTPMYGEKFSFKEIETITKAPVDLNFLIKEKNQNELDFEFNNPINALGRNEFLNYLKDDILVKTDRASMLNSLELRSPFLDKDVIEFAFSNVPDRYKADTKNRKLILKKLARKILPDKFDVNRKKGFSIPSNLWINAVGGHEKVFEIIRQCDLIKVPNSMAKFEKLVTTDLATNERMFSLFMLSVWQDEYKTYL